MVDPHGVEISSTTSGGPALISGLIFMDSVGWIQPIPRPVRFQRLQGGVVIKLVKFHCDLTQPTKGSVLERNFSNSGTFGFVKYSNLVRILQGHLLVEMWNEFVFLVGKCA